MYCHIKERETKLSVLGVMSEVCTVVIIKGVGDKAFCAGGDVRGMYCGYN